MRDDQIKHMVDRFLVWKLPENFNPDGGVSFKKMRNENTVWLSKNEPVGTNLLDAAQAEEMVRYMVEGMVDNTDSLILRLSSNITIADRAIVEMAKALGSGAPEETAQIYLEQARRALHRG